MQGVYAIRNVVTGEQYIGSSLDTERRWRQHQKHLSQGSHTNRTLQAAWYTYGVASFAFEIICETQRNPRDDEAAIIRELNPAYNHAQPKTREEIEQAYQAGLQKLARGVKAVEKYNIQHAGHSHSCPGCGMALRLDYTASGAHLAPEGD